jgi:hypothetical protein
LFRTPGAPEVSAKTDFNRRRKLPGTVPPKRTGDNDREGAKRKTTLRVNSRSGRSNDAVQRRGSLKRRDRSTVKAMKAEAALERKTVRLIEGQPLTVSQLAELIDEKPVAIIKMLMSDLGVMASMTQSLDPATCLSVVKGFGKVVAGEDDMDMDEYVSSLLPFFCLSFFCFLTYSCILHFHLLPEEWNGRLVQYQRESLWMLMTTQNFFYLDHQL